MSYTVTFEPGHRQATAGEGRTLAEIAAQVGIELHRPCGGQGVCGRCAVLVQSGQMPQGGGETLGARMPDEGPWVLACQAAPVSDLVVDVSRAERLAAEAKRDVGDADLRASRAIARGDGFPLARTVSVRMTPPSINDSGSDLTRLLHDLRASGVKAKPLTVTLDALRTLPGVLREGKFRVSVTLADRCLTEEIIQVAPAPRGERGRSASSRPGAPEYGVAVDVGTTTVAAQLVDMARGQALGGAVARNDQRRYGEDVISRIIWSEEREQGLTDLRQAVLETLNSLIRHLAAGAGIDSSQVVAVSCAGNATMNALLLGIEAGAIRRAPHVPPVDEVGFFTGSQCGLCVHPEAAVHLHPSVSGFVGGDITAGVMATGIDQSSEPCLLIDVGTNGEIVVGSQDWLMCASCSAGPAFEGVGIGVGMPASSGAIERLRYDAEDDSLDYEVISRSPPAGVCGTGLLEALASLFEAGVIDRNGLFNQEAPTSRLRQAEFQLEFVLLPKGERGAEQDLVLTQADVEHLIRSKAAVHAGIAVLLRSVGLDIHSLGQVFIAGAFGTHLNLKAAVTIGMIPPVPVERITYAGNSSLIGAGMSLMSRASRERVRHLARNMTYLELSGDQSFMDEYVASLFLPHTDLQRFKQPVVDPAAGAA